MEWPVKIRIGIYFSQIKAEKNVIHILYGINEFKSNSRDIKLRNRFPDVHFETIPVNSNKRTSSSQINKIASLSIINHLTSTKHFSHIHPQLNYQQN